MLMHEVMSKVLQQQSEMLVMPKALHASREPHSQQGLWCILRLEWGPSRGSRAL